MSLTDSGPANSKRENILLLAGILFIAVNLRSALATVGPLTGEIRDSTGLSNPLLGLLTALPLISFGIVSLVASGVTRKHGMGITIAISMALLATGIAMRAVDSIMLLYSGTLILGICIAFGNVILPALTKQYFPVGSNVITGLYTAAMAIGSSAAAGVSVPLARISGWRFTMGIWALPVILALIIWLPQVFRIKKSPQNGSFLRSIGLLSKKRLAWKISFFMGLQSLTSYIIMAWLPEIIQAAGHNAGYAGWMLSLAQASGIIGSLAVPLLTMRTTNQQKIVLFLCLTETMGILGLLFFPSVLTGLWVFAIGFALGAYFTLALLFFVVRSRDTATTTEISGMAQSFGYLLAAPGPIVFGAAFDLTGSWTWPLVLLLLIVAAKLYTGWGAGRDQKL